MPTITELVGRFGFEVDQTGFNQFESIMSNAKRSLGALGTTVAVGGLAYTLLHFFEKAGVTIDFARARAKEFGLELDRTGKVTGEQGEAFKELTKFGEELKLKFALGDLYDAWSLFAKDITQKSPQLKGYFKEFTADAKLLQAAIGDISFGESFAGLMKAVTTGDLSLLKQIPLLQQNQGLFLPIQQLIAEAIASAPDKQIQPAMYPILMQQILALIESQRSGLVKGAQTLSGTTVLEAAGLGAQSKKLGQDAGEMLMPVTKRIITILTSWLDDLDKFVNLWKSKGFLETFKETIGQGTKDLLHGGSERDYQQGQAIPQLLKKLLDGVIKSYEDETPAGKLQEHKSNTIEQPISQSISIIVNGAQDPHRVAVIVKEEIQKSYMRALAASYPVESPTGITATVLGI